MKRGLTIAFLLVWPALGLILGSGAAAVLTGAQRQEVHEEIMRELSQLRSSLAVTDPELKAAVDATDTWIESNQAGYNAALPEPFRSAASTKQKAGLFMWVASKRFGILP